MPDSTLLQIPVRRDRDTSTEAAPVRRLLIALALAIMVVSLLLPTLAVFSGALAKGLPVFLAALANPDTLASIVLSLTVAAIAVPVNSLFGLAAAWAVARFHFPGKSLLVTLIDLPFSVSPVVAGLSYVLLFGQRGYLGPTLERLGIQVIFAVPGIALATTFVTFPFVARELIPLLEQQGSDDEEAALTLGASPLRMFFTITLPNIKWGMLYGVLLCNARALGEFGAVAVVSGHIRGATNTLPLQVDAFYGDYDLASAFAVASILALLALATLAIKTALEWLHAGELAAGRRH